jgi:hypothetical protein
MNQELADIMKLIAYETGTDRKIWRLERGSNLYGLRWRILGPVVISATSARELVNFGWQFLDGYRFAKHQDIRPIA